MTCESNANVDVLPRQPEVVLLPQQLNGLTEIFILRHSLFPNYSGRSFRRRRSRASPVLTAIGLAYGNPVYLTPHRIDPP